MTTGTAANRLQEIQQQTADQRGRIDEIRRCFELLHCTGDVVEVRAIEVPGSRGFLYEASGYFDDFEKAAVAAEQYDRRGAHGVYMTVNQVDPELLARSANHMTDRPKNTTADVEIIRRRWLFIDVDAGQRTGIMATAEEQEAAKDLAEAIEDLLRSEGWSYPLIAESGNGYYRLFHLDLPNDEETSSLLKTFYESLREAINRNVGPTMAKLDVTVHNAARLIRLGGTMNRKGDSTATRPHRRCHYHEPIDECPVDIVTRDQIAEFVRKYGKTEQQNQTSRQSHKGNGRSTQGPYVSRLDVPRWLTARGVTFKEKQTTKGTIYLVQCPFDESHGRRGEAAVFQEDNGKTAYQCKHDSCQEKRWHEYKEAIGAPDPEHYDPPLTPRGGTNSGQDYPPIPPGTVVHAGDRDNKGTIVADNGETCTVHFVSPTGSEATKELSKSILRRPDGSAFTEPEAEPFRLKPITFQTLLNKRYHRSFLVERVLVSGQASIIGGASKTLKTSISLDLAISLASASDFLGKWPVTKRVDVLFLTGESGADRIQILAREIAAAKGVRDCELPLRFDFDLPQIGNDQHLAELERVIGERLVAEAPHVCIIDPIYLAMQAHGGQPVNMADLTQVGAMLRRLSKLGERTESTIIINHHVSKGALRAKKSTDEPMELEDLSQSGFAEWARQWLLLSRREPYTQGSGIHELYLNVGGSMGHSGLYAVDVDEGRIDEHFEGARWQITVKSVTDAREERKRREAAKRQEDEQRRRDEAREAIERVFVSQGTGAVLSASKIRDLVGKRSATVNDALAEMLRTGDVETVENHRFGNGRAGTGWRYLWRSTEPTEPTEHGRLF